MRQMSGILRREGDAFRGLDQILQGSATPSGYNMASMAVVLNHRIACTVSVWHYRMNELSMVSWPTDIFETSYKSVAVF